MSVREKNIFPLYIGHNFMNSEEEDNRHKEKIYFIFITFVYKWTQPWLTPFLGYKINSLSCVILYSTFL
jgi:hypothetical protein